MICRNFCRCKAHGVGKPADYIPQLARDDVATELITWHTNTPPASDHVARATFLSQKYCAILRPRGTGYFLVTEILRHLVPAFLAQTWMFETEKID